MSPIIVWGIIYSTVCPLSSIQSVHPFVLSRFVRIAAGVSCPMDDWTSQVFSNMYEGCLKSLMYTTPESFNKILQNVQ